MAPSMAPTVLPTHTAPPPTISRGCWWVPTVGRHIGQISNEFIRVDQGRHLPKQNAVPIRHRYPTPCRPTVGTHKQQQAPTDRGKLSKAGWVRLRGRERHGWRDRAYMDVLAASPSTGPTPPSHGKPAFDVAVALGRCRAASPAKQTNLPQPHQQAAATHTAPTPCRFRLLLVGVDRWSTHLSDIDIRPRADQRSAPTNSSRTPSRAERSSNSSRRTVEGGVGPVEGA